MIPWRLRLLFSSVLPRPVSPLSDEAIKEALPSRICLFYQIGIPECLPPYPCQA